MPILKSLVRRIIESLGYTIERRGDNRYDEDGLRTIHNHDFVSNPAFVRAYARGMRAAGADYNWRWRVHIGLWAATTATRLSGDFVECGVNRGFLSSAIMELLDWDTVGKTFWLLDTFAGIDESILPSSERDHIRRRESESSLGEGSFYVHGVDGVRANFADWANVRIIVGSVPGKLDQVDTDAVAYLHLDMNSSTPEVAALEFFWPRLTPGAVVLLDDYAYRGYEPQHNAMNAFARAHGVSIASLPTGQGLLLKPVTTQIAHSPQPDA